MGFVGEFGANRVSPRELLSSYVGHLVCIEGIVTKASTVRPKWVRSVHFCPATQKILTREYRCACAGRMCRTELFAKELFAESAPRTALLFKELNALVKARYTR